MGEHAADMNWREAQFKVLLEEFHVRTGNVAPSIAEAQAWFDVLPFATRDEVGRRMSDPSVVGWHLQTPRRAAAPASDTPAPLPPPPFPRPR